MPYDPDRHGPIRIVGPGFRERVYAVVKRVPAGAVTTYGDIGGVLGSPTVARQVGFALAALGDAPGEKSGSVPWHRVVNAKGAISFRGDDGRGAEQVLRLTQEGIALSPAGVILEFKACRHKFDVPSDRV